MFCNDLRALTSAWENMPNPVLELNGARLSRLLRAGIQRLLADQEYLNRINVFPVPDGDTGKNMMLTMRAALEAMHSAAREGAKGAGARAARLARGAGCPSRTEDRARPVARSAGPPAAGL